MAVDVGVVDVRRVLAIGEGAGRPGEFRFEGEEGFDALDARGVMFGDVGEDVVGVDLAALVPVEEVAQARVTLLERARRVGGVVHPVGIVSARGAGHEFLAFVMMTTVKRLAIIAMNAEMAAGMSASHFPATSAAVTQRSAEVNMHTYTMSMERKMI